MKPLLDSGATPAEALRTLTGEAVGHDADSLEAARRDWRRLVALRGCIVHHGHADYPAPLMAIDDAPAVLLVRGAPRVLSRPSVAIVGARAATRVARDQARRLAGELAAYGLTVVSGLARGIDAEAHRGALEAGGATVAVLACGIDAIYPPEHRGLAEAIENSGALVGEMPLGSAPRREYFPLRNRIISGLCAGVVVVEARRRSGSLITVRHALAQGREVFVVPGANDGPFAQGSNGLLREGARAVRNATDIVEDLGLDHTKRADEPSARCVDPDRWRARPGIQERILELLAEGPLTREGLLRSVDPDPARIAEALTDLEIEGRVVEERDGRLHAVWR